MRRSRLAASSSSTSSLQSIGDALKDEMESLLDDLSGRRKATEELSLMKELYTLGKDIIRLDKELENPLQYVSEAIHDFCCTILHKRNCSTKYIITRAVSGSRDESRMEQASEDHPGVAKVKPNPHKGIASKCIDLLIKYVVKLCHPHGIDPDPTFLENFAPLRKETTKFEIPDRHVVEGKIPGALSGTMIRNGPDPMFDPIAHYNWLDGDSMIHAINFDKGSATYVSQYVETSRLKQEQYHGKVQFLKYGDLHGEFGLFMACMQLLKEKLGILDMSQGWSNANTGVVYHNKMLMVLQDWDKPYVIDGLEDGDLYTLGINNYANKLEHNVSPHPKKDPKTGELFILGSSYTPPYTKLTIVSKEGKISAPLEITTSGPTYMHDFGLTKNYVIIMDLPFYFDPKKMLEQGTWIFSFSKKKSRFGILPRNEESERRIQWFEFDDPFFIFHNGNSWEEDEDTLVLICLILKPELENISELIETNDDPVNIVHNPFFTLARDEHDDTWGIFFKPPLIFGGRHTNGEFTEAKLFKLTFDMRTGQAYRCQLSDTHFEYPKINEIYIGRKSRYLYLCELNGKAKIPSIVKYDLKLEYEISKLHFEDGVYGSEVSFVPHASDQSRYSLEEDDGYLTTFVHDEKNRISFAYVICAKKMKVLAKVKLPNRVPYGFHATFVRKEELYETRRGYN